MRPLANIMKNLIVNKVYTKEEASHRVDMFYAYNKFNDDEFITLTELINEVYGADKVEESNSTDEDKTTEETKASTK